MEDDIAIFLELPCVKSLEREVKSGVLLVRLTIRGTLDTVQLSEEANDCRGITGERSFRR